MMQVSIATAKPLDALRSVMAQITSSVRTQKRELFLLTRWKIHSLALQSREQTIRQMSNSILILPPLSLIRKDQRNKQVMLF